MPGNEESSPTYPLVILEICLAPNLGGLELYFFRCCRHYSSTHHPLISLVGPATRLADHFAHHGMPYRSFVPPHWHQLPRQAFRLARLIRTQGVNVVHVHHKQDLPLVALAKQWATFTVVHTRQMHLPHPKKDPYHRFIYSAIDLFVAITDQMREKALKHLPLPPTRIQRLYYGVPPAPEAVDCQSLASDADDSVLVVGMFSRIDPKKGHHTLLEAAGRLKLQGHRIRYHLFGDVADKEYFKRLEQLVKTHGLANEVHFEGFRTQARALMSCMDLVVMPSLGETFGLTVVEAMRSGVAVVGTDSDGIAEIIEHNVTGLLFPPENSGQLAECIAYLYDHPDERHRLAQAGRRDADQRFDEGQHFNQLTKLFYAYHPAPATESNR